MMLKSDRCVYTCGGSTALWRVSVKISGSEVKSAWVVSGSTTSQANSEFNVLTNGYYRAPGANNGKPCFGGSFSQANPSACLSSGGKQMMRRSGIFWIDWDSSNTSYNQGGGFFTIDPDFYRRFQVSSLY